tara:strand:- start:1895 stop:3748 length:1854 start_codon:yes stop_codon:yes gene_type:complete
MVGQAILSEQRSLLRFLTCGSVDDGKSTLIGRLLVDTKGVFDDQSVALAADSRKYGTVADGLDLALLVDGLQAEREQGITIDVAYRFFATPARSFIVADTPGHEQYTRNMATGASTAALAVILIDARKGVVIQTRRHSYIARLLGIRQVLVAVNKMDLVNYDEDVFAAIAADYQDFADHLQIEHVTAIPISALTGDNVCSPSAHMPWYTGPTVLEHLETAPDTVPTPAAGFRLPVQWVNRPNLDFRGFSGTVAGADLKVGDPVIAEPAGTASKIAEIVTADGALNEARRGDAVTIRLADEIDVSRGDVLRHAKAPMEITDQVQAHLIWMSTEPMIPGRQYLMKIGARSTSAWISELKHVVNVNTLEHTAAKTLHLNDIAVCNLSFDRRIACDVYADVPETGAFILIDRATNETAGAGMVDFGLRRADNLTRQSLSIDRAARAAALGQRPSVLWFTGLSGAGKSTLANRVEEKLHALGRRTYLLDGDNVRHGLNRDLGFTDADRVENIRRVGEVAKMMMDAGLIVLVSAISPFRSERDMVRDLIDDDAFYEIFVDADLATCEARDRKGLYARARRGEIKNFTGVDSPYEPPLTPELRVDTTAIDPDEAAERVLRLLAT